ncbi:MAG TPA: AAA family ATPase [Chloroflexota bacterium]
MIYLRAAHLDRTTELPDRYPFSLPVISTLERLEFSSAVTFFAGENGTGKSTLLESIAAGVDSVSVRGGDRQTEETLAHARELAGALRFEWAKRTRQGFFLRAEDFFDYTKRLSGLVAEMEGLAADFDGRLEGYGRGLAISAVLGEQRALVERYGGDLNARSHGESFLDFFAARFVKPGLYLLDEPDTALSPQSVLALLSMIKRMAGEGSQFLIATHSPMLMAYPDAQIFSFDSAPIAEVPFQAVEQIALMRSFLEQPSAYLRRL